MAYFAVLDKTPEISVGNLIGASAVITLLIIPLLAVLNKGITFNGTIDRINFPLAYLVISLPVLLILDRTLGVFDAFILIFAVGVLVFTISVKNTLVDRIEEALNHRHVNVLLESTKVFLGVGLIVFSSKYIVDTTILYAIKYSVAPFLVGLLLLSIGTNLPELTVLIRSTIFKKKAIALGDYVGSAVINTLTLGGLILFNKNTIRLTGGVKLNILLLPIGAILFLYFAKNKKLDRREGLILLGLFALFVILELTI